MPRCWCSCGDLLLPSDGGERVVVVVVVESPKSPAPLELTFSADEQVSIGRDPKSMVQLPDASVSLRHARLSPSPGGYLLVARRNLTRLADVEAAKARLAPAGATILGAVIND